MLFAGDIDPQDTTGQNPPPLVCVQRQPYPRASCLGGHAKRALRRNCASIPAGACGTEQWGCPGTGSFAGAFALLEKAVRVTNTFVLISTTDVYGSTGEPHGSARLRIPVGTRSACADAGEGRGRRIGGRRADADAAERDGRGGAGAAASGAATRCAHEIYAAVVCFLVPCLRLHASRRVVCWHGVCCIS